MTYKNQAAFNNNQAEVETTLVLDNAGLVEFSTIKEYNHVTQLYEERTQSFEYDSLNRVTKTIDPNGHITQSFYNSVNQVEKVIDAEGNVTRNEHDHLGNVVKAIQEYRDANGDYVKESTITNVYENGNELKQYIDDANNIAEYSYDIHSRLETTKLPGNDNLIYSQLYNAMAQVTQATMPDGTVVNNVYNDNTQLESVTITKGTNVSANYGADYYFYEYNPLKQLQQVTCKKGGALGSQISQLGYQYDSSGRVIAESQKHGAMPAKTIQSKFFDVQNKNQLVHPSGTVIEYRRNELGQLHQIAKNNVVVKENTFVGGKQARIQRGPLTQSLVYGNGNELLTSKYQNGNQTIVDYTLGYNKVYYKNFEKRNHESGIGDRYKYDSVYHLIETAYDAPLPEINANGYVKKEAVDYSTTDFRNSIIKFDTLGIIDQKFYQPNALHQAVEIDAVQGVNGNNRAYNRNGNLTQNETGDLYEFDYANRLLKVSTKDANNLPIDVVFTYDCTGRKIQKTVTQTNTNTVIVDEHYYYSGEEVIAEYNASDELQRSYVLGERIDIPVVVTEGLYDYYFVYDTHGSVIAITNANGIVEEKYKYDAHGNFEILIDSAFVSNRYFYTARDWEAEIKLYHNRARFYDPQNGFFIQRDPLGYVDGSNPYLYTSGNSVNYKDPLGLSESVESKMTAEKLVIRYNKYIQELNKAKKITDKSERDYARAEAVWSLRKYFVNNFDEDEMDDRWQSKEGVESYYRSVKAYYEDYELKNSAVYKKVASEPDLDEWHNRRGQWLWTAIGEGGSGATRSIEAWKKDQLKESIVVILTSGSGVLINGVVEGNQVRKLLKAEDVINQKPLRFSQVTAKPKFSDEGKFLGEEISSVVEKLRNNKLSVDDLPIEYIEKENVRLIINTRSSLALKRANIPESSWKLINKTDDIKAVKDMNDRLIHNKLDDMGTEVLRITGAGKSQSVLKVQK